MAHVGVSPQVVEAAIRGEREAVSALVQAYLPRVYGLALRLTRRQDLAEEATQETFVRALRALSGLRGQERLTSWMLTITANTVRELARKSHREEELLIEPPTIDPVKDDATLVRQKALERAVSELPGDERELFVLHTIEGVGLRDLAEERDSTVPAMKSRLHRIRAKLRVAALQHLETAGVQV